MSVGEPCVYHGAMAACLRVPVYHTVYFFLLDDAVVACRRPPKERVHVVTTVLTATHLRRRTRVSRVSREESSVCAML